MTKGSFIKSLEEKIEAMCEEIGAPKPFEFLMQVASGTDPRNTSLIYNMVEMLDDRNGEGSAPDDFDWMELVDVIREKYKGAKVSIGESQAATKLILEYTHSKKRHCPTTWSLVRTTFINLPFTRSATCCRITTDRQGDGRQFRF